MYQKYWKKEGLQHQHPPATRVATPKIGVDNQGRVWYKIDESKPLPVLARGCSHFLYLKTATIVSLAIRIKSTDEGNPLLSLSSKHFFTSFSLISFFPKSRIIPPGLSFICRNPFLTALSTAFNDETSFKSQCLSCQRKSGVLTLSRFFSYFLCRKAAQNFFRQQTNQHADKTSACSEKWQVEKNFLTVHEKHRRENHTAKRSGFCF